ncbi:MAG: aspartyl protease family protein [Saprospiraceae bacterium]
MKRTILLIYFIFSSIYTDAQSFGFQIENEKDIIEIPFEIHNNFMVVQVFLNNSLPLKFIFDTGAEHTILSKNIFAGILGLTYDRPIRLIGADLNQELVAHVSNNVHIKIGDAIAPSQDILILSDDYFKLDEYVGLEIHGIVGADLFRNLVLKIDYKRNSIYIQRTSSFRKPKRKWKEIPVSIDKNKPYILAQATFGDRKTQIKLLVDTGASLSLLLHTNTSANIQLPKNIIQGSVGRGLGGILEGYLGRVNRLEFGGLFFNNIITNYQDVSEAINIESISNRNGILGQALISRFNVIIDYPKEKLYLLPHRRYNKGFKYDRSGLELIVSGKKLKTVTVYNLIKDSPADEAGFKKGDEIISVNGMPTRFTDLKGVSKRLTKKVGKKIKIKIKRGDQIMTLRFKLRDLI